MAGIVLWCLSDSNPDWPYRSFVIVSYFGAYLLGLGSGLWHGRFGEFE